MEIAEGVKLQLCYVLHHLLDLQKRHRVESLIAFAHDYVGEVSGTDLSCNIVEISHNTRREGKRKGGRERGKQEAGREERQEGGGQRDRGKERGDNIKSVNSLAKKKIDK